MREMGRIVDLDGDFAIVVSGRKNACGGCKGKSSCTTLSLGLGNKEIRHRARNPLGGRVGETVVLEISERGFLRASFLVYMTPLAAFFLLGALARWLVLFFGGTPYAAEGWGAVGGLFAMAGSFLMLRKYNSYITEDRRFQPVIAEVEGSLASCSLPLV